MNRQRMQWMAILFPAALVFTYEAFRHRWMELTHNYWGNLAGALIVAGAVYGFIRYYAGTVARAEQELGRSRAEAAVLAERHRIGREMHDSVAQTLFHVRIKLREAQSHTAEPAVAQELARLQGQVNAAYDQVRAVISNLKRQAETEDGGEALYRTVTEAARELGLASTLNVDFVPRLGAQGLAHLQAIVTEALSNARRHGGATAVSVSCDRESLRIQDNGRGFDPSRTPPESFGLMIMEERSRMLGGKLSIDAAPGRGTTIGIHWGDSAHEHPTSPR